MRLTSITHWNQRPLDEPSHSIPRHCCSSRRQIQIILVGQGDTWRKARMISCHDLPFVVTRLEKWIGFGFRLRIWCRTVTTSQEGNLPAIRAYVFQCKLFSLRVSYARELTTPLRSADVREMSCFGDKKVSRSHRVLRNQGFIYISFEMEGRNLS